MLTLALSLLCVSTPTHTVNQMKAVYRNAQSYAAYVSAEGIVKGKTAWSVELGIRFKRPSDFSYTGSVNPDTSPFPLSMTATSTGIYVAAGAASKTLGSLANVGDQMPLAALIVSGLLGFTDKPFSPACLSPGRNSFRFIAMPDEQGCYVVKCKNEPGIGWKATDTATLWIDRKSYHLKKLVMDFKGKDKPEDRFVMTITE